ncbi:hypothetical protein LAJ19_06630 [Deinococcus taeanensis]|uniref:hypothetical protein n=1 Tax=Deinococcus taeanensis TaxID=2737050 RepID=UPI001CDCBF1F|nr:hypothetical protein [Deinococcus taeanensis]UBV43885.1 hypothetical protein LAJ19_06630 [Deinococcus taeanensis]
MQVHGFLDVPTTPQDWTSILPLLKLGLGSDDIVFITLLAFHLPRAHHDLARTIELDLTVVTRVALLTGIGWLTRRPASLLTPFRLAVIVRDLILLDKGLFVMVKSVLKLSHMAAHSLDTGDGHRRNAGRADVLAGRDHSDPGE